MHICKKNDPVSTIIIGGQEQNHLHFIANEHSSMSVHILNFYDYKITGHSGNQNLRSLFGLKKELNAPLDIPSEQNRALHRNNILSQYISIANKATSPINQLFAAHLIHESFGLSEHIELFDTLNENISNKEDSSPYYKEFQSLVEFAKFNNNTQQTKSTNNNAILRWLGIFSFLIIAGFFLTNRNRKSKKAAVPLLSVQEKKVYQMLKEGKSNKEISSELHIEVSTVKSHVYKIYNKLGVKSRKEIVQ